MTFLPIVERELRVASRKSTTYWSRSAIALIAILVASWQFTIYMRFPSRMMGQSLFWVIGGIAMLHSLLCGIRATADSLSEEKREGTLGLLFLTDLKGYDVVLGKMAASSLGTFYGLLAVMPILAIPMIMGGVSFAEFGRQCLVLVNVMLFSLSVGIFSSSLSIQSRKAMGLTLLILVVVSVAGPAYSAYLAVKSGTNTFPEKWRLISPVTGFVMSSDLLYAGSARMYWGSVIYTLIVGLVFFSLACAIAPRSWQDRTESRQREGLRIRIKRWISGGSGLRNHFRSRLLDINAVFWLVARHRQRGALLWGLLVALGGLWAWGAVKFKEDWFNEGIYVATCITLNTLLKIWMASEAGRTFGEDRKSGAIELLLSTPMSVRDIIRGNLLALRRQFLAPGIVVVVVNLLMLNAMLRKTVGGGDRSSMVLGFLGMIVILGADMLALAWVGMWLGLASKNPNRVAGGAVFRILTLPWLTFIAASMVLALAEIAFSIFAGWHLSGDHFLVFWIVTSLAYDLLFAIRAYIGLTTRMREYAMERYSPTPKKPWWRFFGPVEPNTKPPVVRV